MIETKRRRDEGHREETAAWGRRWPTWIVGGLVLYVAALVGFGFYVPYRLEWDEAGNFGDMFGGFSAFASGLGLMGVVVAILLQHEQIKMQRHELELQREELRLQRDELAGSRKELAKQAYISALSARVSALASLKEFGDTTTDLYETNRKLKEYVEELAKEISPDRLRPS